MLRPLLASLTGLYTLQGGRIKAHPLVQTIQPCLKQWTKTPNLSHPLFDLSHQRSINGAMIMMRQGGITALEKALGPSLDSILLSRPVPLKTLGVCDVTKENTTYYLSASTSAYIKLEIVFCSVSVNFQIQILFLLTV